MPIIDYRQVQAISKELDKDFQELFQKLRDRGVRDIVLIYNVPVQVDGEDVCPSCMESLPGIDQRDLIPLMKHGLRMLEDKLR